MANIKGITVKNGRGEPWATEVHTTCDIDLLITEQVRPPTRIRRLWVSPTVSSLVYSKKNLCLDHTYITFKRRYKTILHVNNSRISYMYQPQHPAQSTATLPLQVPNHHPSKNPPIPSYKTTTQKFFHWSMLIVLPANNSLIAAIPAKIILTGTLAYRNWFLSMGVYAVDRYASPRPVDVIPSIDVTSEARPDGGLGLKVNFRPKKVRPTAWARMGQGRFMSGIVDNDMGFSYVIVTLRSFPFRQSVNSPPYT